MVLKEIKPLLSSMGKNKATQEKFNFAYNNIAFEVILLIDREPFELLFGVINYNYSFVLKIYKGYIVEEMSKEVFFKLCEILRLKAGKETFTTYLFIKAFASKIPPTWSGIKVEPHQIAIYKKNEISEPDKIYFFGWLTHERDGNNAKNYEKTMELLGEETYKYCKANNISSRWTANPNQRIEYCMPM